MQTCKNGQQRSHVLTSLLLGIAIGICSMLAVTLNFLDVQAQAFESQLQEVIEEKDAEISQLNNDYEIKLSNYQSTYQSTIDDLEANYTTLQTLYDKLSDDVQIEGEATFSTLAKYSYVLEDANPNCGLTVGMIQLADNLCKEKDVNPDIIWTIIKVESGYCTDAQNPTSTARGLGQILSSSGKMIYEKLMGNGTGTYTHEMAFNGYTNLEMMITYIAYLKDTYGNLQTMINSYSGDQSGSYYAKFAKYMQEFGHNLNDITYAGQQSS